MDSLPQELLIAIAEYLAVHQLARFTSTCKRMRPLWHMTHLWIKVAIAVFGRERMHAQLAKSKPSLLLSSLERNVSADEVMDAYEVLTSVVPATDMQITWGSDPRYWTITNSMAGITDVGERYSESVAALRNVCFFNVSGILRSCVPGTYKPQLRMHIERPFPTLQSVEFMVELVEHYDDNNEEDEMQNRRVLARYSRSMRNLVANHVTDASWPWVTVTLPNIRVPDDNRRKTLEFTLKDHSTSWKRGIVIDAFILERVSHVGSASVVELQPSLGAQISAGVSGIVSKAFGFMGM
ncbi:hypothetical protein BJ741DRAFT_635009 [Chytriomyces cf. hyalinus JEL632]|nr:hypothetical protein BJ741DRAFT_635009 [Chytriomyces cf. hyalinus JEL632]